MILVKRFLESLDAIKRGDAWCLKQNGTCRPRGCVSVQEGVSCKNTSKRVEKERRFIAQTQATLACGQVEAPLLCDKLPHCHWGRLPGAAPACHNKAGVTYRATRSKGAPALARVRRVADGAAQEEPDIPAFEPHASPEEGRSPEDEASSSLRVPMLGSPWFRIRSNPPGDEAQEEPEIPAFEPHASPEESHSPEDEASSSLQVPMIGSPRFRIRNSPPGDEAKEEPDIPAFEPHASPGESHLLDGEASSSPNVPMLGSPGFQFRSTLNRSTLAESKPRSSPEVDMPPLKGDSMLHTV